MKNGYFLWPNPGWLDFCKAELRAIVSMHAGLRIGGEEEDQVRAGVGSLGEKHPTAMRNGRYISGICHLILFFARFFQDIFMW